MKCWLQLKNFGQFCEKIRGIHHNLIEVQTGINKYDENSEVLEDEIEEHIFTIEDTEEMKLPIFSIESDLGNDGDATSKRCECSFLYVYFKHKLFAFNLNLDFFFITVKVALIPKIVERLEEQLSFEAKVVHLADMEFDRISRFIAPECGICKEPFESFDECHEHYLTSHGRSASWNCCNLLLETPYDVLDHLKYHESIDVFK